MVQALEITEILSAYPGLAYKEEERVFRGTLSLSEGDTYTLEIDCKNFPASFPKVIELDERIPRKVERHVNHDNTLCFTTPIMEAFFLRTVVKTLKGFFEEILIPYLLNNSYYEIEGAYSGEEYSHNYIEALFESYKDLLGTSKIFIALVNILTQSKIRPNDLCYRGSGDKIKGCRDHLDRYKKIRKLDPALLLVDLRLIYAQLYMQCFAEYYLKLGAQM